METMKTFSRISDMKETVKIFSRLAVDKNSEHILMNLNGLNGLTKH